MSNLRHLKLFITENNVCLCIIKSRHTNCLSRGITSTSGELKQKNKSESEGPSTGNDYVSPNFINRNPRNLEQLGLARKPAGWKLQYPSRQFYHRLTFKKTLQNTEAKVIHNNGRTVVSASTKEYAISKHLYSKSDVSASHNIGRVLAQRCLESGITCMTVQLTPGQESGESVQSFLKSLKDGGVELEEPVPYVEPYEPGFDYDNPTPKSSKPRLKQLIKDMVTEEKIQL